MPGEALAQPGPSFERWMRGSSPRMTRQLSPAYVMPRQHLAHLFDQVGFAARELRRAALAPFLVGGDCGSRPGAFDQILDLHFAARFFIGALNDHAGRVAAIGIFE